MADFVELAFDNIEHETPGAILFNMGEKEPTWVPRSVIEWDEYDEDSNTVPVALWRAEREGLV